MSGPCFQQLKVKDERTNLELRLYRGVTEASCNFEPLVFTFRYHVFKRRGSFRNGLEREREREGGSE